MKFQKSIQVVDSHTMGEPTRIIVGGIPNIPGKSMPEKKVYLEQHMDYIRTGIMHEPRGHNDMFGAIVTAPTNEEADLGVIFMDGGGYLNMCGHGSIGTVTVAIETGMVPVKEPFTYVTLEAPAGLIRAKAKVKDEKVQEVTFRNVPSFCYKRDVKMRLPELGKTISFDIAFGGSFFAIVSARELGLKVEPKNARTLITLGLSIRDRINREIEIRHPLLDHIRTVDLVEIYDDPANPAANAKNAVVFGEGQLDRSPCGTGTSAKLATLFAKGLIQEGKPFVYESILGTLFEGKIVGTTKVGDFDAVIPEITGAAYITGFDNFVFDEEDPVEYGFSFVPEHCSD